MKIYRILFLISFLITISIDLSLAQHSILGSTESCYEECKVYNLSGGIGGPYYWKTTGDIQGTNQGSTVEICWNTIGSNAISLVDFSAPIATQTQQINVAVVAIPTPDIIRPKYPECTVRDSMPQDIEGNLQAVECWTACSASTAFYGFEENNGASMEWEVEGGSILSETTEGITIQWDPSGSGYIKLIETNALGCIDSLIQCVEILEPLDVDILAFNGGLNSITVCAEQEVYLQALGSLEATNFEWDMGDGSYNYGKNITASYDEGGIYDIMLIGSSECKCFDTSFYQIIVDSNPGPEITCTGTTCGNEAETYYAANTCGSYTWNISSNGSIIDGGGSGDDYITINWNNGPVGTVGLSTSGCSEAVCANETVVQIPIIDGTASIDGPAVACKNGHSSYTVQYYNGTEYIWNVANNGSIISGWGTNQITVQWNDDPQLPNDAVISVNYENCYLECGGQASLNVDLKPEFQISFQNLVCTDKTTYFNSYEGWNNAVISWTITSPSGVVSNYPNVSNFNAVYTELGNYTITGEDTADDFCNDKITSFFEVVKKPDTPISIDGPLVICKNEYYNYSIPLPGPGISAVWNVYDGSIYKQYRQNVASIQWTTNGPYEIRVYFVKDDVFCRSEDLVLTIEAAQNATISGSAITCVDEVDQYSVGAENGTLPEWTIAPSNAGSIIHNPDNTIDVMWHISGNHQITSDYCGTTLSYNVTVNSLGINSVIFEEEICPGETTPINCTIPASSTVVVKNESGIVIGNSINEMVTSGKYEVEITTIDGCMELIPVVIDTFLPPKVRVSSPDPNAFCLPHPNVSIVALDTKDGLTYEWFFNGSPMGISTSSISTNQYGSYHVQVTDKNGCTSISNAHRLVEWCGGDPPDGTCTGGGGILDPDAIYLRCNNLQFAVTGTAISSTSFNWQFDDPDSGVNNTSNETNPIHEFTNAGYYYVFVRGNEPGENGVNIFTVPAAPRFDYESACAANETQFRNHSTFIPGFNIIKYIWNFGDPSSGTDNASNNENPKHVYNTPGTYLATLEIESADGCLATYELEVIVEPGPLAEYILPSSACSNDGILFEAFQDDDIYVYEWNFDDPTSGTSNTSNNALAIHTFSNNGSYNVSLSVSDGNGCMQSITKTIDVTTTNLSGNITPDRLFPMCYGEEVTLTAPSGGDAYIWSDGSTGQVITVSDPGIYYVTISESTGCDYVPDPINVVVEGIINTNIRATHLINIFTGPSYFDSLVICEGELFSLSTSWISGATYLWSTGNTSTYINEYDLTGLPPGRHDYTVSITDPASGCLIESEPLTVIVNPLPTAIQISTASATPCEGEEHVLTIDNPETGLIYYWSTGDIGLSTTVNRSGSYTVTAKNKNGCEKQSPSIYVAPLPNANRINLGCTEACFPDTICIPNISGAFGYQWLLDGSPITGSVGTSKDLIADQAGEYQLIVENFYGCQDTSDILSIEAEPSNQSVSGIVFIDDNNNGTWDAGEQLLSGVPVNLFSGSLLETTIITDIGGYYNFDPVLISNPRIEIDTTGLGLNLTGGLLLDDVNFLNCIEDKEKDFPLNKECVNSNETIELFTCAGETIVVNSIVLQTGDTWTFDDTNSTGCDSSTFVIITAFPDADVNLITNASCQNIDNGSLDITIMAGSGLQFAVDNPSSYTTNLQFDDLAPGTHMLWMTDANGCIKNYSFEIEQALTPEMNTISQNTCINANTGNVQIIPNSSGNYQYSLDGITFSANTTYGNLAEGPYTFYVQEDNSCIYEYPFVVAPNPEPQFDLLTGESCNTGGSGTLNITPLIAGTFEYSLDNLSFTTSTIFNDLQLGTQTLYVQEIDGCIHNYPFEIIASALPEIDIVTTSTCEGENQGSITVSPTSSGNYEYSIDGITFSNDLEFINLPEGAHMVYVLEDGVCQFQFPTTINTQPLPVFTYYTENACLGEANGGLTITTTEIGIEYSLDQINFSADNNIENLEAGFHTIYIKGENNCIHPFDIEVFEALEMEVEFFDPVLDCSNRNANLAPTIYYALGDLSYSWSTGETDSTIVAQNSGQYTLSVADKCSVREYTWDIKLEEISKDQPVYFPNIFSPNQDGVNECFVPTVTPETTVLNYHLTIFDRWGNKYFETTDMDDCWDGLYNGRNVRTGVFVYLLEMDYTYCVEVENLKKYGDVTVVF